MESACAEKHIDIQNTNLPKIHTYRNIYDIFMFGGSTESNFIYIFPLLVFFSTKLDPQS